MHGRRVVQRECRLWGQGRRGLPAPVDVQVCETVIVALASYERMTEVMMRKILKREFPRHYFRFKFAGENIKAISDRWTDDRAELEKV